MSAPSEKSTIHISTICERDLNCVDIAVGGRQISDLVEVHRPGVGLDRLSCRPDSIDYPQNLPQDLHKSKPTVGGIASLELFTKPTRREPLIHAEPLSDTFVNTNEAQNPGGANMFEGMIIMGLYIIALVNLDKINGT